jgi:transcriptional repressor NrdR
MASSTDPGDVSRHPAGHHRERPRTPSADLSESGDLSGSGEPVAIGVPVRSVGPSSGSVQAVRCPSCARDDDKVVDSRANDDGSAIRRRRECLACGHRFTTFERCEEVPLLVLKRSGDRVPFDGSKVEAGIRAAAKGRPIDDAQAAALAREVADSLRLLGVDVTSEEVGLAVLDRLRDVDEVAYVRFASVYKGFDDAADFQRELRLLKETEPKRH